MPVFAAVGWVSVTLPVAGEIPKALVTVSPTYAPTLGAAIERAVASEPTAIAVDPLFLGLLSLPDSDFRRVYAAWIES